MSFLPSEVLGALPLCYSTTSIFPCTFRLFERVNLARNYFHSYCDRVIAARDMQCNKTLTVVCAKDRVMFFAVEPFE